jgi:sulfur relay (sulfurtransferase) DsrF/TusC family protein
VYGTVSGLYAIVVLSIKSAEQLVLLSDSQFNMVKNQSYGMISGKVMNNYLQQIEN